MKKTYRMMMCHTLLAGAMAFTLGSCGGGGGGGNSTDKGNAPDQFLPKGYTSCQVDISIPTGTSSPIALSFTCKNSGNGTQGEISDASAKNIPNFPTITSASGVWSQNAPTSYNRLNGMCFAYGNDDIRVENMVINIDNVNSVNGTMQTLSGRAAGGALYVQRVGGELKQYDSIPLSSDSFVTITYTPKDSKPSENTPSGGTEGATK